MLSDSAVKRRFEELLGDRTPQFITSVIGLMNTNKQLNECEPGTVIGACAMAAAIDLQVGSGFGYCGIIPFKDNKSGKTLAQYQTMTKGFVQLATRSNLYSGMGNTRVYAGQLKKYDPLFGRHVFDWDAKTSNEITGYAGGFVLTNGQEKIIYMNVAELIAHGKKYSKSFKYNLWTTDSEVMYLKTPLKLSLSKWGPLSIDYKMAKAVQADQGVIKDFEDLDNIEYADSKEVEAALIDSAVVSDGTPDETDPINQM